MKPLEDCSNDLSMVLSRVAAFNLNVMKYLTVCFNDHLSLDPSLWFLGSNSSVVLNSGNLTHITTSVRWLLLLASTFIPQNVACFNPGHRNCVHLVIVI